MKELIKTHIVPFIKQNSFTILSTVWVLTVVTGLVIAFSHTTGEKYNGRLADIKVIGRDYNPKTNKYVVHFQIIQTEEDFYVTTEA